ncbi:MAG: glycosyltransferase family 39 protein [Candidatus Paceibacterota bacterium]|jgi:4-amino-4-deoxy-L-arabinose transferase-like glycosyltransferase
MNNERALSRPALLLFGLLLVVSGFLYLFRLGASPLADYDEATYAQVIKDTEREGAFGTLYRYDGLWFEKPPLQFWLAMGAEKVFGENDFALRLPSALSGIVCVALVYLIALLVSESTSVALLAGVILLATGSFLDAARQLRMDVPVTAALLFSFYAFLRGRKDARWYLGIGIGIGIGILIKSVIGLFVLPLILLWSLQDRDFSWLKNAYFWYGAVLSFLIILPWHLYEGLKFGSVFWDPYLLHHVLDRFASDVNGGSMSNWGYAKYTFLFGFPWVAVFLVGCLSLCRRETLRVPAKRVLATVASCAIFILAVFAFAKTKVTYYVIPAIPFIALFCALWFQNIALSCRTNGRRAALRIGVLVLLVVGVGNMVYVGYHFQSDLAVNASIVYDEYRIGKAIAERPYITDVRAFQYFYWETLRYYSDRVITIMKPDDTASAPFFMIIETYPYHQKPFPPDIMEHLSVVYEGEAITLLEFKP